MTDAKAEHDKLMPIGIHLQLEGRRHVQALDETMAKFPELTDIQIFTHGPQSVKAVHIDEAEFKARLKHYGLRLWVHGSYLSVPWKSKFLAKHTLDNILAAKALGAGCVVVHIPFIDVSSVIAGILPLVHQMRDAAVCDHTKLMLETSATVSDPVKSYETPLKLNRLTAAIYGAGLEDCVRICIDSAHIFAGRAAIGSYIQAKEYCDALDARLIGMIQLNGNSIDPDKGRGDKHEIPMSDTDLIWGGLPYKEAGCRAFIEFAAARDIPVILEVNPRHPDAAIRKFLDAAIHGRE